MKKLILYALLFFLTYNLAFSQIAINEIAPLPGRVELKNVGDSTIDVDLFLLCSEGNYTRLVQLDPVCGDLSLKPGEIIVVSGFDVLDEEDGELAFYTFQDFNNPDKIMDYVEWGSSGHDRSAVAQAAGIWGAGQYVAGFPSSQSLEYDGGGNGPEHWNPAGINTLCEENSTLAAVIDFELASRTTVYPNPAYSFLQIDIPDRDQSKLNFLSITDVSGRNLYSADVNFADSRKLDISFLDKGLYFLELKGEEKLVFKKFIVK